MNRQSETCSPVRPSQLAGASLLLTLGLLFPSLGLADVLLRDDFDGTGNINTTVWRIPFGEEGNFLGRTQLRTDPSTDIPQQSDGVARLLLDTFSPLDPGNQFLGSEMLTKRNFARGGGLSFEARLRLVDPPAGLVNGFFSFDVQRDSPPGAGNLVRDEIDHELISAFVADGTHRAATNVWNDGPFSGEGSGGDFQTHTVQGLDLTEFHTYRVDWQPDRVQWLIDGAVVRSETSNVPDDPMKVRVNLWAPDAGFSEAYDAGLQPTAVEGSNQQFVAEVDYVQVSRGRTIVSDNLLNDASFEEGTISDINLVAPTTTGEWIGFSNVFIETEPVVSGTNALKAFGPFKGTPDASGVFQNVEAQPGQQFEASVFAQSSTTVNSGLDPIAGTENFATVAISFLDANGDVIKEAFGSPSDLVDTNGKDFPLLDGRDPNLVQDQFVQGTVNAVAPAGTAFARMSLFFVQLNNEGGAVYFDDAFLGVLSEAIVGDMDLDGDVDFDDIDPFVLGLNDPVAYESNYGISPATAGDTDGDGDFDFDDIPGFVTLLGGGSSLASHSIPEPASWVLLLGALCSTAITSRRPRGRRS